MSDIVSPEIRSRMMRGIRAENTKPEIAVRKWLHSHGYRFRLHRKDLPGKPDIVLPRHHLIILVHGCFWHRHENCHLAAVPHTRTEWWMNKFRKNVERDRVAKAELERLGWRVETVWECETRNGKYGEKLEGIMNGSN